MADVAKKAVYLCTRLMSASDKLMQAVYELDLLKTEKESSGLDLTSAAIEAALAESLPHCDGTLFNSVLSSTAALKTWLESNGHDDNFQKVRP